MAREAIRSFLAIEIPKTLKNEASVLMKRLEREHPDFRFLPPELWHLTLHFFGDLTGAQLLELEVPLAEVAESVPAFSIQWGYLGAFPNVRHPRILWLGIAGDIAELNRLKSKLDQVLVALKFPVEPGPFVPHVTVARVRKEATKRLPGVVLPPWRQGSNQLVDSLALFSSQLRPQGAQHNCLKRFFLASRPPKASPSDHR